MPSQSAQGRIPLYWPSHPSGPWLFCEPERGVRQEKISRQDKSMNTSFRSMITGLNDNRAKLWIVGEGSKRVAVRWSRIYQKKTWKLYMVKETSSTNCFSQNSY